MIMKAEQNLYKRLTAVEQTREKNAGANDFKEETRKSIKEMVEAETKQVQRITDANNKVADERIIKATNSLTNRMDKVENAEAYRTAQLVMRNEAIVKMTATMDEWKQQAVSDRGGQANVIATLTALQTSVEWIQTNLKTMKTDMATAHQLPVLTRPLEPKDSQERDGKMQKSDSRHRSGGGVGPATSPLKSEKG